ncbi:MAG: hypothetical protein II826_07140 [Prevotella sp.]|nr:hypothetical protein [Prevotella sp.]
MTLIAQQIRQTPMAPYVSLMQGMSKKDKLVLMAFLVDSMQEQENHENMQAKQMVKPNPFPHFRKASEFAEEVRAQILEKMRRTSISPETKSLVGGLSLTKEELQDERTRYILGLDK